MRLRKLREKRVIASSPITVAMIVTYEYRLRLNLIKQHLLQKAFRLKLGLLYGEIKNHRSIYPQTVKQF